MSAITVDGPLCPAALAARDVSSPPSSSPPQRRTRFCTRRPATKEVTHRYPPDYFYSRLDVERFRAEARLERRSSVSVSAHVESAAASPARKAFGVASSSLTIIALFIFGLVASTIAYLPVLLLLKISSTMFSSPRESGDSSVCPDIPSPGLLTMVGRSFLVDTRDEQSLLGSWAVGHFLDLVKPWVQHENSLLKR